jgi:hypothetical protein
MTGTLTEAERWTPVLKDGRTVGVVILHVETMYPLEIRLAQTLAAGNPVVGVTWDLLHQMNAKHAREHATVRMGEALAPLRRNSTAAAAALRALSDQALDQKATVSLNADAPLTCRLMLEDHALKHSYHHLARHPGAVDAALVGCIGGLGYQEVRWSSERAPSQPSRASGALFEGGIGASERRVISTWERYCGRHMTSDRPGGYPTGRRPPAAAVQTAVGQAGSTAAGKLAAKRLASAVQPDPGVTRRDPRLLGKAADADAVQINTAKRRAIFRLEGVHQRRNAGAGHGLKLLVGRYGPFLGLGSKLKERPGPCPLTAVMVDEGIAEHAVEPRRGRLCTPQRVGPADTADERLLQNILRLVARSHPALQEAEEACVVVEQQAEHVGRMWVALRVLRDDGFGREAHRP